MSEPVEPKPDLLLDQLREISYQLEQFVDPLTTIAHGCDARSVRRSVVMTAMLIGAAIGAEKTVTKTYNDIVRSDWTGFRS